MFPCKGCQSWFRRHCTPAEAVTQGHQVMRAAAANFSAMAQVQQPVKLKCCRPAHTRAGNCNTACQRQT